MIQYFTFEEDFVEENIRCIPMIVRFKLDACGIKLSLKEWSSMNAEERTNLAVYACATEEEIQVYRKYVRTVVLYRTSDQAKDMEIDKEPVWANRNNIPETVAVNMASLDAYFETNQWKQLNDLQRFVLVKLSRPGHENRNFPIAMKEFGLL